MTVYTPCSRDVPIGESSSIFLGGSIENGAATDWQKEAIAYLDPYFDVIYNPRREDWDSAWEPTTANPKFVEQVNWELDHLDASRFVLFHFEPGTKSPITLLEMGLQASNGRFVFVSCPDGYWRQGNVEIVAKRAGMRFFTSLQEALEAATQALPKHLAQLLRSNDEL